MRLELGKLVKEWVEEVLKTRTINYKLTLGHKP